jgi:hypothetical protein
MHKILAFKPYQVTPLSACQHVVDVVRSEKIQSTIASGISLVELYDNHVKPGHMLYLADQLDKTMAGKPKKMREEQLEQRKNRFAITEARPRSTKPAGARGPLKVVVIMLTSPITYVKVVLNRAHTFLLEGSPVEVRVRLGGKYERKQVRKKAAAEAEAREEKEGADGKQSVVDDEAEEDWVWIHQHFPHVRPDFIIKGMPEGTVVTIDPVRDAKQMNFVMELPTNDMPMTDLNVRLGRVKQAVGAAKKKEGMASASPEITAAGGEQYSRKDKQRNRRKEMWPREERAERDGRD